MTTAQIAEIVGTVYKPWFPSLVYSETDKCYIDEATDTQLRECYHTAKGTWTDYLRAVYNLGRTHGENRVCARLPRLWGLWKCSQRWEGHFWNVETTAECHRLCMSQSDLWTVREFDPRTGEPRK